MSHRTVIKFVANFKKELSIKQFWCLKLMTNKELSCYDQSLAQPVMTQPVTWTQ